MSLARRQREVLTAVVTAAKRGNSPASTIVSLAELSDDTGFSKNTLKRHLRASVAAGCLSIRAIGQGRGHKTEYSLHLPAIERELGA